MSDIEKFNVDSDLQSIADAMTAGGINFCGGVFDHLETGEEFEITISNKSSVKAMSEELKAKTDMMALVVEEKSRLAEENAELREALTRIKAWDELSFEKRLDIGSNGQRDYYRNIATEALNK